MNKNFIMIEVTKEEKDLIKQKAKNLHLTMSAYIRLILFKGMQTF